MTLFSYGLNIMQSYLKGGGYEFTSRRKPDARSASWSNIV